VGSVVKKVGGILGIGGNVGKSNDSGLTQKNFDVTKEAKKYEDIYAQQRQEAQARSTAANAPALIQQLSQQAMGQGPSLAEAQLKSATNRNLAQQLAAAASMRGRNPAAAQRQVLMQQGDAGRQLAEQSAVARLQEQQQAMQQLTQQQQLADQAAASTTQSGFQAALAPKTSAQQYDLARAGVRQQNNAADKQVQAQVMGQLIGAGGQALAGSDENNKTNIKDGSKDVSSFLNTLSAKNYEYKDSAQPGTAPGKRVGIIAQDLEKSDMGKTMVKDTPNGKMVDTVQGFGAVLAALSELNERMNAQEGKKPAQKMADGGVVQDTVDNTRKFLSELATNKVDVKVGDMKLDSLKGKSAKSAPSINQGGAGTGNSPRISNMSDGGKVAGKAKIAGDSEQNDTVDVKLSPGEIVIPRTAASSPEKATAFVQQLFATEMAHGGRVKKKGY
jgi:hypothetical protein